MYLFFLTTLKLIINYMLIFLKFYKQFVLYCSYLSLVIEFFINYSFILNSIRNLIKNSVIFFSNFVYINNIK